MLRRPDYRFRSEIIRVTVILSYRVTLIIDIQPAIREMRLTLCLMTYKSVVSRVVELLRRNTAISSTRKRFTGLAVSHQESQPSFIVL